MADGENGHGNNLRMRRLLIEQIKFLELDRLIKGKKKRDWADDGWNKVEIGQMMDGIKWRLEDI